MDVAMAFVRTIFKGGNPPRKSNLKSEDFHDADPPNPAPENESPSSSSASVIIIENGHKSLTNGHSRAHVQNGVGSGSDSDTDSDSGIPAEEYEVETIMDYRRAKGSDEYFIKWKGWAEEFNTWEPPSNLTGCPELLYSFYLARKEALTPVTSTDAVTDYVSTDNGHKRRKSTQLLIPPDPRPFPVLVEEFVADVLRPTKQEAEKARTEWNSSLVNPKKTKLTRWPMPRLEKCVRGGAATLALLAGEEKKKIATQVLYFQLDEARKKALEELTEWETELNALSEGKPRIRVENEFDCEGRPTDFTFSNDYVPAPGIIIPNDPPFGCSCPSSLSCLEDKKKCCPSTQSGHPSPYNQYRRLRVPPGTPIYECNSHCLCGTDCVNRVVQDGRSPTANHQLTIFRTSNGCGWGVKTQKVIKKGSFVSLYIGEIINTEEAERRGREYDAEGCTYLFDLDFNEKETCPYTVDAKKVGNVSHFINHSCDPNLGVFAVWVNCLDPDLPNLALFALKEIEKGEELTFDYKSQMQTQGAGNSSPRKDQEVGTATATAPKKPCLCGAANCRKFLF